MNPTYHRSTRDSGLRPRVIVGLALVFGLFLSGCASREGSPSSTASSSSASSSASKPKFVPGTSEALAPFREVDLHLARLVSTGKNVALSPANPITLRLAAGGRLAGKSAVNRFFGTYELSPDGTIHWPNAALGMTRMAGPESAMELESTFASVLTASQRLVVSSDTLRFESKDHAHIAEFKK
ncbi:MAG: META domain-containing protein [Verrucomicrobiales bacterium]|nr:META domain-containing protein [Verrucomicrobiales bacterium]